MYEKRRRPQPREIAVEEVEGQLEGRNALTEGIDFFDFYDIINT